MGKEQLKYDMDFRRNLKNAYNMAKPYKGRILVLFTLILILESTYVLEKYFLKVIIDEGTRFSQGTLGAEPFVQLLFLIGAAYVAMVLSWMVIKFLRQHFINRIDSDLIVDMKERFFNHILRLDHNFHSTHKTGSMISRMSRGARSIEGLMDVVAFNFAPLLFLSIATIFALTQVQLQAAAVMAGMIIAFVGYGVFIQIKQYRLNVKANYRDDVEKGNMSDFLLNVESVKYYGKEDRIGKRYTGLITKTRNAFLKMWDLFRFLDSGHALILGTSAFLIVYVSVQALLNGTGTVGDIAFVFATYGGLVGPLFGFMHGIRHFSRSMADFESLYEYDKYENEIKDAKGAKNLVVKTGTVEFKNINFAYHKANVFDNFSLKIKKNEKVALVGHSGSGKSTLIKLLYRLYDVQGGEILVDGKNTRDFKQRSLREELSIVPQEALLFDDTLANNVRFSRPNATKKEVEQAMRFAQLDRVIEKLPNKEHTIVGERGVKLSGGEKQRVSIARALLANKKILILDEATSALDSQTEHEIQQDLLNLMKGRTSIVIAHRLSTIMTADKIVVLDEGKIAQIGTHKQLVRKKGIYKELWDLQKGGFIE